MVKFNVELCHNLGYFLTFTWTAFFFTKVNLSKKNSELQLIIALHNL